MVRTTGRPLHRTIRHRAEMENMFATDLAESDEIMPDQWKKRPLLPRLKEWLARLLARWL